MNTQKSRRKYNKKNIALIVLIIIMLEANANLVLGINTIHENGIKADLFRIMSLKSLTSTFITYTTDFFTKDVRGFAEDCITFFEEHITSKQHPGFSLDSALLSRNKASSYIYIKFSFKFF